LKSDLQSFYKKQLAV